MNHVDYLGLELIGLNDANNVIGELKGPRFRDPQYFARFVNKVDELAECKRETTKLLCIKIYGNYECWMVESSEQISVDRGNRVFRNGKVILNSYNELEGPANLESSGFSIRRIKILF